MDTADEMKALAAQLSETVKTKTGDFIERGFTTTSFSE